MLKISVELILNRIQPTAAKAKPETQQATHHNATQTPTVKADGKTHKNSYISNI